ncbi:hypothetical protein JCM1841_001395 [Sporobolomyces salmonicolor]
MSLRVASAEVGLAGADDNDSSDDDVSLDEEPDGGGLEPAEGSVDDGGPIGGGRGYVETASVAGKLGTSGRDECGFLISDETGLAGSDAADEDEDGWSTGGGAASPEVIVGVELLELGDDIDIVPGSIRLESAGSSGVKLAGSGTGLVELELGDSVAGEGGALASVALEARGSSWPTPMGLATLETGLVEPVDWSDCEEEGIELDELAAAGSSGDDSTGEIGSLEAALVEVELDGSSDDDGGASELDGRAGSVGADPDCDESTGEIGSLGAALVEIELDDSGEDGGGASAWDKLVAAGSLDDGSGEGRTESPALVDGELEESGEDEGRDADLDGPGARGSGEDEEVTGDESAAGPAEGRIGSFEATLVEVLPDDLEGGKGAASEVDRADAAGPDGEESPGTIVDSVEGGGSASELGELGRYVVSKVNFAGRIKRTWERMQAPEEGWRQG